MSFPRHLAAALGATLAIAILAWVAGRSTAPPDAFSFDRWENERRQKEPLIERARIAGAPDLRPTEDPAVARALGSLVK